MSFVQANTTHFLIRKAKNKKQQQQKQQLWTPLDYCLLQNMVLEKISVIVFVFCGILFHPKITEGCYYYIFM